MIKCFIFIKWIYISYKDKYIIKSTIKKSIWFISYYKKVNYKTSKQIKYQVK